MLPRSEFTHGTPVRCLVWCGRFRKGPNRHRENGMCKDWLVLTILSPSVRFFCVQSMLEFCRQRPEAMKCQRYAKLPMLVEWSLLFFCATILIARLSKLWMFRASTVSRERWRPSHPRLLLLCTWCKRAFLCRSIYVLHVAWPFLPCLVPRSTGAGGISDRLRDVVL